MASLSRGHLRPQTHREQHTGHLENQGCPGHSAGCCGAYGRMSLTALAKEEAESKEVN